MAMVRWDLSAAVAKSEMCVSLGQRCSPYCLSLFVESIVVPLLKEVICLTHVLIQLQRYARSLPVVIVPLLLYSFIDLAHPLIS